MPRQREGEVSFHWVPWKTADAGGRCAPGKGGFARIVSAYNRQLIRVPALCELQVFALDSL